MHVCAQYFHATVLDIFIGVNFTAGVFFTASIGSFLLWVATNCE